jgi:hypothetical protein
LSQKDDAVKLTYEDFKLLQHLHYDFKSEYEKYGYGKIISKFLELQPQILKAQENIEKIKKLMIWNNNLGGRMTLTDTEQLMYILTGEYHNSKCPQCQKTVSCVCTSKCNHIWYCPDHILDHTHRQTIGEDKVD